jgi:hypothetical protein
MPIGVARPILDWPGERDKVRQGGITSCHLVDRRSK